MSPPQFSGDFEKRWFKDFAPAGAPQKCWICGESLPGNKMASHWTSTHLEAALELDRTMQGVRRKVMRLIAFLVILPIVLAALYVFSVVGASGGQLLVLGTAAAAVLIIVTLYTANVVPARVIEKHRHMWFQAHPEQIPEKRE